MNRSASGAEARQPPLPADTPFPAPCPRRILLVVTEDWFALSHFQPLITTLVALADEVVVATRSSGRLGEIAALGARVIPFDLRRAQLSPLTQAAVVRRLARLIRAERPDVVHVIAMQPMVIASLALRLVPETPVMLHLTGLGFLGISEGRTARFIRPAAFAALAAITRRRSAYVLAENPEDHAYLVANGAAPPERYTLLGGAGIDPDELPALPPPAVDRVVAAFVGRMIKPKGVEVLIEAARLLAERRVPIEIALYGRVDDDNPDALDAETIRAAERSGLVRWHGHVSDISAVWRCSDIAVLPAITREGMPRAVLEAAASQRPLVVTDVPGCRHFVRPGRDGLIVPPGDAVALADALQHLASDRAVREAMGVAARQRVLDGFTIAEVQAGIRAAYGALLAACPPRRAQA
ncbi:MAG: glycosyltransferase family 4 protein [Hyphomicrobiaceae bacterium]|nr:glycosyltransferase family 4 protein [Hyphomicrobiaceae bacterium]